MWALAHDTEIIRRYIIRGGTVFGAAETGTSVTLINQSWQVLKTVDKSSKVHTRTRVGKNIVANGKSKHFAFRATLVLALN